MKKWITLTAMIFATGIFAQEKIKDAGSKTDQKADKMEIFEKLNLTEQQKVEITTLFEEQKAKRMEKKSKQKENSIHSDKAASLHSKEGKSRMTDEQRQAWKVKKEAKRKETDAKLQKILTKEQFQQYESERALSMKQKENFRKNKNQ